VQMEPSATNLQRRGGILNETHGLGCRPGDANSAHHAKDAGYMSARPVRA